MKCIRHPSMQLLVGKSICTLDEDWSQGSYGIESDQNKFEYELRSNGKACTRGSYQRYLKHKGLTDDISFKELRKSDLGRRKRKQVQEEGIKKITDRMFKGFHYGNQPCQTTNQHQLKNRLERMLSR